MKTTKLFTTCALIGALITAGTFCHADSNHERKNGNSAANAQKIDPLATAKIADLKKELVEGNARFIAGTLSHTKVSVADIKKVTLSPQSPKVGVVSCSDARITPDSIFDSAPGDIYSIRNAGGVAGGTLVRSIAMGIYDLKVPFILFLAHSDCNTTKMAIEFYNHQFEKKPEVPENVRELANIIQPAIKAANKVSAQFPNMDFATLVAIETQWKNIEFILTTSPYVRKAILDGKVTFDVGTYDMKTGKVSFVDSDSAAKRILSIISELETKNVLE